MHLALPVEGRAVGVVDLAGQRGRRVPELLRLPRLRLPRHLARSGDPVAVAGVRRRSLADTGSFGCAAGAAQGVAPRWMAGGT